ncbi:chitinase-3-like protein 2 isoform X1 [Periplaneta americana]|uniref:chitinase-3-like protein 2 isoform X1 n=1 Tax=Periplaneta americana TaxID=6978 RepID=UPI0037E7381F
MSGVRQLPQAKYELLIENKRPGTNIHRSLTTVGLIVTVAIVTSFAVYVSWKSLKTIEDRSLLKKLWKMNSNNSGSVEMIHHRTKMYGLAMKQYIDSNQSDKSVSVTTNKPSSVNHGNSRPFKLVCYYSLPNNGTGGDLMPEEIYPSLCTHINIAFARIVNGSLQPASPAVMGIYKRVVALKSGNPSLKVLLSVGGGSEPGGFAAMTATHASRKSFIRQILALLKECGMDGLDLDWEFPAWQSAKRERVHFTQLLMELREELNRRHSKLLVSVAVAAPKPIIDDSYDVIQLADNVDYINVMTYDFHFYVWYLPWTGFNAPLYKEVDESGYFATLNTNWTAFYWESKGMPKEKIVVGLPTYGHSFKLINEDNHGPSAPASGFGTLGDEGFVSYPEACQFVSDGAASVFDRESRVPYAFKNTDWISFDDERSLAYKAEYITNGGYGGAMIWSLNMDDFKGQCSDNGQSWFPLVTKVKSVLEDDELLQMELSLTKALGI